jgi:hypothetical protein
LSPKLVHADLRAALRERGIPALANCGFHFRELTSSLRDRDGRETSYANATCSLIPLPPNARLEGFDAGRFKENVKATAES